jgi:hypothetical protein
MTKALVPASGLIPAATPIRRDLVHLDLYPDRLRNDHVFTVHVLDESEGEYGPDGRRRVKSKYAESIDIYA